MGEVSCDEPNFIATYFRSPQDDEQNLVIHRNDHGIIFLNRYPYANGHLLVALGDANPTLLAYNADQRKQLWNLVETNIGMNEGEASGAGIPQHVHIHIVPRWSGDTNFMSTTGEVRIIPCSLEQMFEVYSSQK